MTAPVTLLIPVWNRGDLLQQLLNTVSLQTCSPREVIVIDNGSTDDAASLAARWGARVISMGSNRGFAVAVNRGIFESLSEWIGVVNSDVELRPDWLRQLLNAATETHAWFATGKILSAADPARIDGTWDLIARSGCAWRAGQGFPDSVLFSQRRLIAMSSATAAIYRRDLFDRVGGFTEDFESYLEDVDLSLRCAAAGLQGIYEPSAVCLHHGSASTGRWSATSTYLISRNQELLVRRLFSQAMRKEWRWRIAAGHLLWGLIAMRHGRIVSWLRGRRDARRIALTEPTESLKLRDVVTRAEQEILQLQRKAGMDWYWRVYFFITGNGSQ